MKFITQQDFSPVIRDEFIGLVNDNPDNETEVEASAISKMSSYLRNRFDVSKVFSSASYGDKELIKEYLVDIMLHRLHARTRQIPAIRKERYAEALDWLEGVAMGDINPDLPALPTGTKGSNDVRHGGGIESQDFYSY